MKQGLTAIILVAVILIIDQWIKIDVKTTMALGESHEMTSWYYVYFIENNGMAWGMSFIPKIALSLFRLVAIMAIGWYMTVVIKKGARWIYVILLAMVLAGAAGNLIDCMFYGMIFSESTQFSVSHFVPFGQGYSEFLQGKVVDMFYFPIIQTTWPQWMPFCGGERFIFFSPIFNFADSSISVSVIALILFCRKELTSLFRDNKDRDENNEDADERKEDGVENKE